MFNVILSGVECVKVRMQIRSAVACAHAVSPKSYSAVTPRSRTARDGAQARRRRDFIYSFFDFVTFARPPSAAWP